MYIYEWIEYRNKIWFYLNGMITIILNVTPLGNWLRFIIRKVMGLE